MADINPINPNDPSAAEAARIAGERITAAKSELNNLVRDVTRLTQEDLSTLFVNLEGAYKKALDTLNEFNLSQDKGVRTQIQQIEVLVKAQEAYFDSVLSQEEKLRIKREVDLQKNIKLIEEEAAARKFFAEGNSSLLSEIERQKNEKIEVLQKSSLDKQQKDTLTSASNLADQVYRIISSSLIVQTGIQQGIELPTTAAQTAGALRGAGRPGAGLEAQAGASEFFGGVGGGLRNVLAPAEELRLFNEIASKSPRILGESSQATGDFLKYLGYFGNSVSDSIGLLEQASINLNFSAKDLEGTYAFSNEVSSALGINTNKTAELLLGLATSLRGVGGTADTAAGILTAFAKEGKVLGDNLSQAEIGKFSQDLAGALGQMRPEKLVGLVQFVQGGGLPSIEQLQAAGNAPLQFARESFQKLVQGVPEGTQQLLFVNQFAQLLGVNVSNLKELVVLRDILKDSSSSTVSLQERLNENFPKQTDILNKGFDTLKNSMSPLTSIDNTLKQLLTYAFPLANLLQTSGLGAGAIGVAKLGEEGFKAYGLYQLLSKAAPLLGKAGIAAETIESIAPIVAAGALL